MPPARPGGGTRGEFDAVVGIARGGSIVGATLSFLLSKEYFPIRLFKQGGATRVIVPPTRDLAGRRVLLVDDLSRTGETFKIATHELHRVGAASITTCALVRREPGFKPDLCALTASAAELWSYAGNPDTYEAYVCRSVLADVALENGQLEKAESLFAQLIEAGERRQFRIPLAMVYFGLAYIHLETKRDESGLDYARKALQLIQASRAFQLFLDQGIRSKIVTEALIRAGERSTFLERVLENLPEKQNGQVAVQNHSYSIQVQCFGNFRVVLNGEEVSQERWV